ncbi:MAG: cytochrome c biogenesis protein ResB [bacterium]
MNRLAKILRAVFKFLSSLKLAVVVILSLAYVLAMGTIYESLYGTAVAKDKVYGTWWFSLVLFLLGVNVLCAALSRLPWKRHHIGFVITHAGIITILIGSVMTQKWGIDGTVAIAEGEQEDRITLDDPLFQVVEPDQASTATWAARFSQKPPNSEKTWVKKLKDGSQVVVDRFLVNSQTSLSIKEGTLDNPAMEVVLTGLPMGGGQEVSQWLFLKPSEFGQKTVQIGPARFSFVEESILKSLPPDSAPSQKIGILKLQLEGDKTAEVDVEEALKKEVNIAGTPYRLKVTRYLPDARVNENKLVSRSDQPNNPAVELKILGASTEETHVVFSNFPDLEGIHGNSNPSKIHAFFVSAQSAMPAARGELYLATNPQNEILYRVRVKGNLSEIKTLKVGEEVPTGWMTIRFKVAQFFPKALPELSYRKVNVPVGKSGPPPAIRFHVEHNGQSTEDAWLQQGDVKEMTLGGVPYLVRYGLRAHPLGFNVKLKKFEIGRYAGTNNPSSFASYVEVKNTKTGESFDSKIYMNNPLHYEGYTLFQASYQEGEKGQPNVTVLSVARDPGTPIKYLGSILLVGGIALMFWFKPLFVQKRLEAKRREKLQTLSPEQVS